MYEKPLEFVHMHKNKTFFFLFEMRKFFNIFFKIFGENSCFFNIGSVSYSVSLHPTIK